MEPDMKINNKVLMELIGVLTVTASLVFVGIQLMFDRKVAIADQYFNRTESVKEDRRTLLLSPVFFHDVEKMWALGEKPPHWNDEWEVAKQVNDGTRSIAGVQHRILELQLAIIGYDNIYFQYQQGLIGESSWQHFREQIKRAIKRDSELTRTIYLKHARSTLLPIVQEILLEIELERKTTKSNENGFVAR
jgi:hypothetical protein